MELNERLGVFKKFMNESRLVSKLNTLLFEFVSHSKRAIVFEIMNLLSLIIQDGMILSFWVIEIYHLVRRYSNEPVGKVLSHWLIMFVLITQLLNNQLCCYSLQPLSDLLLCVFIMIVIGVGQFIQKTWSIQSFEMLPLVLSISHPSSSIWECSCYLIPLVWFYYCGWF